MKNDVEKAALLSDMINLLLILATIGIVLICVLSPTIVSLLFSKKFEYAATMLVILSVSIFVSVFSWSYSTLLIHKGAVSLFTLSDTIWMLTVLSGISISFYLHWSPISSVLIYSASSLVSVALYLGLTARKFGRIYLPYQSLNLAGICVAIVALSVSLFFYGVRYVG